MRWLIILLLCVFHSNAHAKTQADAFGGAEQLGIVLKPETAWIQRVAISYTNLTERTSSTILSARIPIGDQDIVKLSTLIGDPQNIRDSVKGCLPRPGLLFGFKKGNRLIEVAVCLECSMFFVFENEKIIGGQHCDKTTRDLLLLALRFFPNDKALLEMELENKKEDKRNNAVSPKDGSKLKTVKGLSLLNRDGIIWIMKSEKDGSIWVYEDDRGVYDPKTLPKNERDSIYKNATDPR